MGGLNEALLYILSGFKDSIAIKLAKYKHSMIICILVHSQKKGVINEQNDKGKL